MYTEEFKHNSFIFRKLLLKVLLIGAIILFLIWMIPKFISYKPSNKGKQEKIQVTDKTKEESPLKQNLLKLKNAALIYYKEEELPVNSGEESLVSLKELQDKKLVSKLTNSKKKACNTKDSYAKLTKLENDYLLKLYLKCEDESDYLLVHVGKYENCTNLLCEKTNEIQEKTENQEQKEKQQNNKTNNNQTSTTNSSTNSNTTSTEKVLSQFTEWSSEAKTSCDTKEVVCKPNDFSCLTEVRITSKIETTQVVKEYHPTHLVLYPNGSIKTNACRNYNYVMIQNQLYATTGNYEEVLSLNKTSTNNWTYKGTISSKEVLGIGGKTYYKFAGIDFSSCKDTCTEEPAYYYDVYEYTKPIGKVSSATETCNELQMKTINSYKVVKQKETIKRQESTETTVCYQSTRSRKVLSK